MLSPIRQLAEAFRECKHDILHLAVLQRKQRSQIRTLEEENERLIKSQAEIPDKAKKNALLESRPKENKSELTLEHELYSALGNLELAQISKEQSKKVRDDQAVRTAFPINES
jgi:hypothetical protein